MAIRKAKTKRVKAAPRKRAAAARKADAVVTEIIRNGLVAITEQMKSNLMRTACNMIIYEAQDFTVGLFDASGNIVLALTMMGESPDFTEHDPAVARLCEAARKLSARLGTP